MPEVRLNACQWVGSGNTEMSEMALAVPCACWAVVGSVQPASTKPKTVPRAIQDTDFVFMVSEY